jgi:malonyl-CoA decarboxylase
MAIDPVAHFHLSNGARIERLNWLGDVSARGVARSCGLMVNYLYRPDEIEANHEAYRGDRRVAMTSAIRSLLRG